MKKSVSEINEILRGFLKKHVPQLRIQADTEAKLEVSGTKEVMQGKKKVDGIYFATVMPKAKDARLYFFPIYTHPDAFANISPALRKCLKGKSCFHIKKLDESLEADIESMIDTGVKVYLEHSLL